MGITKTLGGDRVGAGKKMTVNLENFGRSTHDQTKIIRTDQAFGTLVPYYCNIGLNGDTFYMNAQSLVRTLPTVGPIFGSAKQQIEFYHAPIRLYVAALHNNALGIGMKMQDVKLPTMTLRINNIDFTKDGNPNAQQISQDSLLAYLGIRGGGNPNGNNQSFDRTFPAMFNLMYWDIYKNYYANKQEEIGYVITGEEINEVLKNVAAMQGSGPGTTLAGINKYGTINLAQTLNKDLTYIINKNDTDSDIELISQDGQFHNIKDTEYWNVQKTTSEAEATILIKNPYPGISVNIPAGKQVIKSATAKEKGSITLTQFPLSNIDDMREAILAAPKTSPYSINSFNKLPYNASIANATVDETYPSGNASWFNQAGLGIKTYLSDRFNNWLSTEWIDGVGGINDISAVNVSDGKLTMDALILSKKVFELMNRIAVSGGSYNDWQEAVYGTTTVRMAESPVYAGGFSSELVFDEVVSNSAAETSSGEQPLGSLAGRGASKYAKGGQEIKIKCSEPSMIMVIGSFTPRIDYSQGNKWWNRLQTMNDFHKPNLDAIGFQELLTEEFAAFDTIVNPTTGAETYHSVGKQPSWIEYMTEVNETYGSFAAGGELEFMAFNRIYDHVTTGAKKLKDGTTYIDPTLYNVAFADAKLSAKNIWVQVEIDCKVRRVMSAKQIPNL